MSNFNNKYRIDSVVINLNCFLILLVCYGYFFIFYMFVRDFKVLIFIIVEIMSVGG